MTRLGSLAVLASLLVAGSSSAYSVGTGFSDACHERITVTAASRILADLPASSIPPPRGLAAEKLSAHFARQFNVSAYDEPLRNLVMSLVIGVREPDTHGRSLLEFENTRNIHASPEDQYSHALRGLEDDGPDGDLKALEGTRARIKQWVEKFQAEMRKPREEQFVRTQHYLDFYGLVEVEVWSPAFYLAEALHTLQDSFSHSLRSSDFRRIRHVLNYGEAISVGFSEHRDGLRHSESMDLCAGDTLPLMDAATEASVDFLHSVLVDPDHVDAMLDRWMQHEEGCTLENEYCESSWLEVARRKPTMPYLGCGAAPGAMAPLLPLVLMRLWVARRRRSW